MPVQSWPMKIIDPRIMKSTQITVVVTCGLLIGYLIAQSSLSTQDWVHLGSMTAILLCFLFVMFNDVWKRDA
jgi:hypothetical protein